MAHRVDEFSTGGHPRFDDPGGPTGSDTLYRGDDLKTIPRILGEIALPIPEEVEGEILRRGDGTLAFCNSVGLSATRACLMNIDEAQSRIDNETPSKEVVAGIRKAAERAILDNDVAGKNSACAHHCQLAFTRECELASGEVRSPNGSASRPMTDEEALDFIGVELGNTKKKNSPDGRWVFKYFFESAMGMENGFSPAKIVLHSPRANLAESYIISWFRGRRPSNKTEKNKKVKQGIVEEQLRLEI